MRRVPIIVTALAGHTQEHSQSMLVRHTIQIGGWPRPPLPRSMISFVRLGVNRAMNCGIETCAPDHVRHPVSAATKSGRQPLEAATDAQMALSISLRISSSEIGFS